MAADPPFESSADSSKVGSAPTARPAAVPGVGPRKGRVGPVLVLLGFLLIGLGFLFQAWEFYHYITPPGVPGLSFTQLQDQLFEWAILYNSIIGAGILVATAGWIVDERDRTRWFRHPEFPARANPLLGFALAALGAVMIAGDDYFNVATTYAALRGVPWTLPAWISSGAFTAALDGA
jgi:hypothetical protein